MPQTRMRMRPWLELQINSNKIPGLVWINKEEQLFQIPWKHAAKHGWELEKDACLFKNWAIHTGRYKEGDIQPDPKTWKANFRCAMNSLPDIEEVKDKSISKGSSAVRVYRMLPPSGKSQKKEKKTKSSKIKNGRKSVEDIKVEETVEAAINIQLPDDHRGYSCHSCTPEEMEAESTSIALDSDGLSTCDLGNTDWKPTIEMNLPDSTNDMYPFQVSPFTSSSEATDEDDDPSIKFSLLVNASEWQQTCIGGKGFLSNEAGSQSSCFEYFSGFDVLDPTSSDLSQTDARTNLDFHLMDLIRVNTLPHPITCSM